MRQLNSGVSLRPWLSVLSSEARCIRESHYGLCGHVTGTGSAAYFLKHRHAAIVSVHMNVTSVFMDIGMGACCRAAPADAAPFLGRSYPFSESVPIAHQRIAVPGIKAVQCMCRFVAA